jgi:hypothetical protein
MIHSKNKRVLIRGPPDLIARLTSEFICFQFQYNNPNSHIKNYVKSLPITSVSILAWAENSSWIRNNQQQSGEQSDERKPKSFYHRRWSHFG